jgi:hypothetical protein
MLTKKTQIEDESKSLNLKSAKIKVWIFFKEVLFFNKFDVLFNHSIIIFQKINHDFRLQRSITPNMNIIRLVFDDENELILKFQVQA